MFSIWLVCLFVSNNREKELIRPKLWSQKRPKPKFLNAKPNLPLRTLSMFILTNQNRAVQRKGARKNYCAPAIVPKVLIN